MMRPRSRQEQRDLADAKNWPVYTVFGLKLSSNFEFANRLLPGQSPPDLLFSCTNTQPDGEWQDVAPTYTSPFRDKDGQSILFLYRTENYYLIRFTGIADFYIETDRIVCHLLEPKYHYLVEICLLGTILALFLETEGRLPLHGSAICIDDFGAVAFLAGNHGGKSSLAASFMRDGYALLSDDILATISSPEEIVVWPSYPQMRLGPEEVKHFCGTANQFDLVHPDYDKQRVPVGIPEGLGRFCGEPKPLKCIYLIDRKETADRETPIAVSMLSRAEALIELMRYTFEPEIAEAMGFQNKRLRSFATLARSVLIRRLSYPSDLSRLREVKNAILRDVRLSKLQKDPEK